MDEATLQNVQDCLECLYSVVDEYLVQIQFWEGVRDAALRGEDVAQLLPVEGETAH